MTVCLTLLCGIIYLSVQQTLRHLANDPQIQLAEDIAAALSRGETPALLRAPTSERLDIAQSLAPFVITYNANGQPEFATGRLDGKTPTPPSGVLEHARVQGQNRVTWMPRHDVRCAAVVVPYSGAHSGFVLAARSLRETEVRVSLIGHLILVAWLASLVTLALATLALALIARLFPTSSGLSAVNRVGV